MIKIAIVGTGQIGSRHLQAMAKLEESAIVYLVEPSDESIEIARKRFQQVYNPEGRVIKLERSRTIAELKDGIDVAIVATSSDVRADIVKELVQANVVKSLVLEKFLFQKVTDYYEVDQLLRKYDTPTWVNCWMRDATFFKKLKERLDTDNVVQMRVEGSQWGIGCKGIHFLDLFSYLTDDSDIVWSNYNLDEKLVDSKRSGFKEFTGTLTGKNSKGHSITFVSHDTGSDPLIVKILNDSQQHEITFNGQSMIHKVICKNIESLKEVAMPLQSETTHRIINQIIEDGSCNLPTYEDSQRLHLCLVETLIMHMQTVSGRKVELCPIT